MIAVSGSSEHREHRDREDRIHKALANPAYFAEVYFRPYDPMWTEMMAPFAVEMVKYMATTHRGVVILPPEFMKTTLLQCYAIWRTVRAAALRQFLRGMLASEEEGMAKANLSVVTWHIENNERLAADFVNAEGQPLLRPDPTQKVWRDDAIIVARDGVSRDPTWQAKGLDSKGVQGRRIDCLLADDLITPKNADSQALRKRALDLWDKQFTTRLIGPRQGAFPPSGQAIVCGNFNDRRDLLMTLAARPGYKTFKRPSLHLPGRPDVAPKDSQMHRAIPTWPQVWPKERLMAEKLATPRRFRAIHMLDPREEGGGWLKTGWVRRVTPEDVPIGSSRFFIGLDAAPGSENENPEDLDFVNISVGALHGTHLDLVECLDFRGDTERQVRLIWMTFQRFMRLGGGVIAVGGAQVGMDRYLRGALTIAHPELGPKLVPISVPGSKETRLEALGPYAQSGYLRVLEPVWTQLTSDESDQWQELSLADQWQDFPHAPHDDKLDGVDILVRTAQEFAMVDQDEEYDLTAVTADD